MSEARTPPEAIAHELNLLLADGWKVNIEDQRGTILIEVSRDGIEKQSSGIRFGSNRATAIAMELNILRRCVLK